MKRLKYFLGILSMFLGCLFGIQSIYTVTTPVSVIAATKQGWDGDYYYDNGYALKGLQKIGDVYYLFDKTTGKYTGESGKQLYLGSFFKDNKTIQGQMFFTLDGEHLHHIDTGPFYGRDMSFIYKNNSFYGTRTKGAGRTYGFYVQDSSDLKTFNRSSVTNLDFDVNGYEGLWAPEWLVDYTGDTTGDYVYYCAKDKNDILRYDADGNPVYRWKIYRAKTESLPDNFVEPELCTFDDYDKKTTIGINSEEANTLGIESRKASPEMLDPAVIKINGQYIMSVKWLGGGAGSEHIDIYTSDNGTSWTFKSTIPCFNGNPIKNDIPTYSNKDIYLTGGAADDTTKFYAADGYEAPTIAYVNGVYYCYVDHYVWTKIDGNEAYEDGYTQADGLSLDGKCYYATSTDLENWTYQGTLESEGYPLRHGSINPISDEAAAKIMKLYSPVTVTFNNNGADNPEWQKGAITVGSEGNTSLQSSLFWYKRGHIFSSWNTEPDGSGTKYTFRYEDPNQYTSSDFEGVNTELYAQYTPAYTRIRYDKNGGTGAGYTDEFITVDKNYIFKENNLTKEGYVFDGWDVNGKTYKPGDKLTEFNAVMQPEKKVKYDSGLEDGMWYNQGVTVFNKDNRKCILASYCATTGNADDRAKDRIWLVVYDFNTGEILQKKLCSKEDTGFNLGHSNGLCWNPDDGYFLTTTQVKLDANLNKIDDAPVEILKHADGSRFALSGIAYRDQKFYGVSGKWLGVFDRNGNLLEEYDTYGCIPDDFNNSRAFNGQDTGVGEEFLYQHMFIGSACNTYIVVKPKSDLTQTYYFNYLCGNISKASERREVQDSYYDDELDKTYFFTNPSSGAVADGNTYMLVHDGDAIPTTSIKARWVPETYDINYELDGGVNHADNPDTYSYGSSVTLKSPTREGYRFTGWNPNDGKISSTDTGDKTFIANWVKQVTVKFTDGQGNILKTSTLDAGGTAVPPENPSRVGFTFAGWDKDYSNITSDATINAKWIPNVYNIFYILNGGVLDNKPDTYTYGKGLTLGTPVRTGYTFLNWSPNNGVISSTDTGDKTFTANWVQKFTVTFTDGFGRELKTQQVDIGSDAVPPANPVRVGYVFDGWDKSYNDVKSDLTVNAKWKAIQKINILFKDDKQNTLADTLHYTGTHGESVPLDNIRAVISDLHNRGYDTNYVVNEIIFDNEEYHDQDIEIYFTPHVECVTTPKTAGSNTDRTGVVYPSGLSKSDISKVFTRIIKYEDMEGKTLAPKVNQSIESKRNAYFNYVTGEVTYDDWSGVSFNSVTSPVIKGYECDNATVPEIKAVKDETVTVLYKKVIQKANVTFKDSNNKVLADMLHFEGIEGENIPVPEIEKVINSLKNKGYDTDYVLKDMTFDNDASKDQNIDIIFTEHIETITQPKTAGSNTDRMDIVYPKGLSDSDLNKTFTRRIYYKNINGEELLDKTIQTVKKSRTARFNYVTGEVEYSDYSKASFPEVKSPVLDDLIYDKSVVSAADAVSDIDVTVTYNKISQKGSVRFTDGTKDIAPKEILNGFNAESITYRPDITVMALMNKGYDIVNNNFPKNPVYDRDVNADQDYVIEFRPHIEHITCENPKSEGMRTDRSDVVYSSGLNESDLSKTITRRIKFVDESGREIKDSHIDKIILIRSAGFNYVTGEVSYSDWSTSEFDKFTVPGILGYVRDTDEIEGKPVDVNSEDETVVVIYKEVSEDMSSDSDIDTNDVHDDVEIDIEIKDDLHTEITSEEVMDVKEIDKIESDTGVTTDVSSETVSETVLSEETYDSSNVTHVQESDKNKNNTITAPSVGDSVNLGLIIAVMVAGTGALVCSVFLVKRKR